MANLTFHKRLIVRVPLALCCAGWALSGCVPEDQYPIGLGFSRGAGGAATGGQATGGQASGGQYATGGQDATGGRDGRPPRCESGDGLLAYVCAGSVYENKIISQQYVYMYSEPAEYACPEVEDDERPVPGAGGALIPAAGGSVSFGGMGGEGGWSTGGASSTGGQVGGGGFGFGGESGSNHPWCADLEDNQSVAGVSYSVDDCGQSELALPLRYTEPDGWYHLRVYAGESPCERDEVVAERAGYGLGEAVELPVDWDGPGFLSIEFISEHSYYWGGERIQIELNSVAPGELE